MNQNPMSHWKSKLSVAALCIAFGPLVRGQAPTVNFTGSSSTPASRPAAADRAFLGVSVGAGENDGGGVKLEEVVDGSPAQKAGLKAGDVITALGDRTIGNEAELREVIASHQVGEKLRVTFLREGEKRRTSARLAKAPAEEEQEQGEEHEKAGAAEKSEKPAKRSAPANESKAQSAPKAQAPAPKAQTRVEAGPPAGAGLGSGGGGGFLGVQPGQDDDGRTTVEKVFEGTAAEKAGLKEGDVIVAVDGSDVGSAEDLVKLISSHKAGDRVTITVERDGAKQKLKARLGERSASLSAGGGESKSGSGAIAIPVPPSPPEAIPPATAAPKPARVRGRIGAPAGAEAQGADTVKKELDELRSELEKTRREMDELRRKCESQQRTLDAVKRAIGGEPGSTSMAAPETTPGGEGTAVFSIQAPTAATSTSTSAGMTEITVAKPAKAEGCDCCVAGEGQATAASTSECPANGVGQIVISNGEGPAQFTLADGKFVIDGKPLSIQDFTITTDDGKEGAKELQLGGQIELKLDDGSAKQIHVNPHGDGHAMTLKPTGENGTFEIVVGEGDEKGEKEDCCESGECDGKSDCCKEENEEIEVGENGEKGGQTIVLELAGDENGNARIVRKAALGGTLAVPGNKAASGQMKAFKVAPGQMKVQVAPANMKAIQVAPAGGMKPMKAIRLTPGAKQTIVLKDGENEDADVFVLNDGGKGGGEGGCCCQCGGMQPPQPPQPPMVAGQGAPTMRLPRRAAPAGAGIPGMAAPPAHARAMRVGGMGGMPGAPAMARKVDNGGGMALMRALHSGGSFTWRCDGPCELKVGPDGAEFHCEGSCEISRGAGSNRARANPRTGTWEMLGAGMGHEDSESAEEDEFGPREDNDDDEDDDDAPAGRSVATIGYGKAPVF